MVSCVKKNPGTVKPKGESGVYTGLRRLTAGVERDWRKECGVRKAWVVGQWLLALVLTGWADATPAQVKSVSAADARAIRAVVEAQLDAFARDDAGKAFSLAAPQIQLMFGEPDKFMRMVKNGYPVVYRPASVTFLKPELIDGEMIQPVQMSDQAGEVWVATYRMQRQQDNLWRINGCELERSAGRVT
jgi:Domain of unknown function (DUF4864)